MQFFIVQNHREKGLYLKNGQGLYVVNQIARKKTNFSINNVSGRAGQKLSCCSNDYLL